MKRRASFYLFSSVLGGIFLSLLFEHEPHVYAWTALMPLALLFLAKSHLRRVLGFLALLSLLSAYAFSYAVCAYKAELAQISEEDTLYEGEISDWWRSLDGTVKLRAHMAKIARPSAIYQAQISLVGAASGLKVGVGMPFRLRGVLRPMEEPLSLVHFDAFRYGLSHHLHGTLVVSDPRLISLGTAPSKLSIKSIREALRERFFAALTPHQASLLLALIIGDTSLFSVEQKEAYQSIGAQHLLAVSGLQVALIAALSFFVLRLVFGAFMPARRTHSSHQLAALITLLLLWFFIALTLWPRSAVRAGLMSTCLLVPLLLGRTHNSFDAFFLSGFIALLIDPLSVLDIGFLLSYTAVFALLIVHHQSTALRLWLKTYSPLALFLFSSLVSALAAFIATLPIVLIFFGTFSPWSTLANWLLVPLVSLLQVPAIIAGLLGALLSNSFLLKSGALCAQLIELLVHGISEYLGALSFVPAISNIGILGGSLALFLLLLALLKPQLPLALIGLALLLIPLKEFFSKKPQALEVSVFAIGQGDATLFSLPSGEHILIDSGGQAYGSFDPGESIVLPSLKRRGIKALDLLLITHPDPDHVLGAFALLDAIPIRELWHSGFKPGHPLTERLLEKALTKNIIVKDAYALIGTHSFGTTLLEVLAPISKGPLPFHEDLSANDNSMVVRFIHDGHALLWPGDIEYKGEALLLKNTPNLRSTIVKAPHHGSKTSSSEAFIKAVDPRFVIYSTGTRNRFGHPHAEVYERYAARNIASFNTATDGEIRIRIEKGELSIKSFRKQKTRMPIFHNRKAMLASGEKGF